MWRSPCGVVANILDCDIIVSVFDLQMYYYVHFQTNTFVKDMNSFIFSAMT